MARLAIDGGSKAFRKRTGKLQPKIGIEEFLSIAERFGFSPAALKRIRAAVRMEDLPPGGPHLGRYYGSPGPSKGEQLEALVRNTFGVKHVYAVSSGTGALHAAFIAAGAGPGTEVICPGLGFMATAMAVELSGGVPIFCDVDESLQMDPERIEACITPRTVALAPTHHWGNVADLDPILKVARKRKLKVVEDCAQAPGGKYRGRYVGTLGDIGCFSISSYKIIGAGESGLVVTGDGRLFDRLRQAAEGGGLWRPDRFAPPRYRGELFPGSNYRLSELEAAADLIQFHKIDEVCNRYRAVSRRIRGQLRSYAEITPQRINDPDGYIGFQLRFFPKTPALGARITRALVAEGVAARTRGPRHKPDWHVARTMYPIVLKTGAIAGGSVFEDPRYLQRGGSAEYRGICPVAADLFAREVAIDLDEWLSPQDCDAIAEGITKVLSAYCAEQPEGRPWA